MTSVQVEYRYDMTFPAAHYLLTFGGTLPGAEQFSQSLRLATTGFLDTSPESGQSVVDDYAAALQTAWAAQVCSSGNAKLTWCKINAIGVNGKYSNDWTNRADFTETAGGGPVTSQHPNQVSLVTTLLTGTARGLAARGRMFWPVPGFGVSATTGVISPTDQGYALTAVKDFIEAINAVNANSQVAVMSKVRTGAIHLVTSVAVGRVLDTMRSRRQSLKEEATVVELGA